MITTNLQSFVQSLGLRCYVKRPTPIEGDWRLANWEMPCVVLMPAPTAEYVRETSGTREVREFDLLDLRTVDVTFDTAEADTQCEAARVELLQLVQQLGALFHVEQRGGRQIWDSANGWLIVGWSVSLRLTELVGLSACDGLPVDPAEIEITENGTYNVLPFGRAVVDVQGGSPAVVEQLDVKPDYDAHTFTPPEGVDGFAPVNVAACPIPQTETLHVTPSNVPQTFTPSAGNIGFNIVDVDAAPKPQLVACPVTPTTSVQHITPPAGTDGFSEVDVQAVDSSIDSDIQPINIRQGVDILGVVGSLVEITKQPLNITPSTSAQTYTAPTGEAYDPVQVDAVTAAIDPNITADNIKQGVSILGVTGTMEQGVQLTGGTYGGNTIDPFWLMSGATTAAAAQAQSVYRSQITEIDDDNITEIGTFAFSYCDNLKKIRCINAITVDTRFQQFSPTEEIILPSCTSAGNTFVRSAEELRTFVMGTLTSFNAGAIASQSPASKLRLFEVGQDTDINLDLRRWTATNVIAEGQSGIDELNYNIATYLAARVKDNSGGGPTRTITFGTSLYNVLTADTISAFTDKGWSVAYA